MPLAAGSAPAIPTASTLIRDESDEKVVRLRVYGYCVQPSRTPDPDDVTSEDPAVLENTDLARDVFTAFHGRTALIFANRKSEIEACADFARREAAAPGPARPVPRPPRLALQGRARGHGGGAALGPSDGHVLLQHPGDGHRHREHPGHRSGRTGVDRRLDAPAARPERAEGWRTPGDADLRRGRRAGRDHRAASTACSPACSRRSR